MQQPHPLAERIHNRVLQLLGAALMQSEMCEQLQRLGREDEIPGTLAELRTSLEQAVVELRAIMKDLRDQPAASTSDSLKNHAA